MVPPGPSTARGGATVTTRGATIERHTAAEQTVTAINTHELMSRRLLHGRDLNDYHATLLRLQHAKHYSAALELLHQIISVTHTLPQYDDREPDPYWAELAAHLHIMQGDTMQARRVLSDWLAWWPEHREPPTHRIAVISKARRDAQQILDTLSDDASQ